MVATEYITSLPSLSFLFNLKLTCSKLETILYNFGRHNNQERRSDKCQWNKCSSNVNKIWFLDVSCLILDLANCFWANIITWFCVADDLFKVHKLKPNLKWRQAFDSYLKTLPPYYLIVCIFCVCIYVYVNCNWWFLL